MRLFELFENVPSSDSLGRMKVPPQTDSDKARVTVKGSGSYGTVYQDRDNPHEVMKFSTPPEMDRGKGTMDGYLNYIREIAANENIQENPWVPRIRKLRLHRDKKGVVVDYSVRLESLQQLSSLKIPELLAMGERLFKGAAYKQIEQSSNEPRNPEYWTTTALIDAIRRCIYEPEEAHRITNDDDLIQYAHWHAIVHKRNQRSLDIRGPNIMVRRTPYGTQPVITDPWA